LIFRFDGVEIDADRYELRRAGSPVPVEPKVLDLLLHLVRERERLVTKDELLAEVWRGVHVSESTMTRAMSLARAALGDSAQEPRVIETVPGRGYRWKAPVEVLEAAAAAPARPRPRLVQLAALSIAVALALAAAIALAWPRPLGWLLALSGSARPPEQPAVPSEPSVVVLPFRDLSADAGHAHLAEGVAEDLTAALVQIPTLFVIASGSAATYRGRDVPLETVARELGVRYAVEGTVRTGGGRLVVTSRLVEARSGVHIWGDRFEAELDDALAVQGRLAEQIVGALGARIEEAELARLRHRPTDDFDAYELFLQARSDFFDYTRPAHARARERLERALARDPDYAPALVLRGALETAAHGLGWDPSPERLASARKWIARGLEQDPYSPLPYAALAMAAVAEGRSTEGLEAARRAVELAPNWDVALGMLAATLLEARRPLEALRALDRALRLNPRRPELYWLVAGFIQAQAGRRDQAAELYERVRQANTDIVPPRLALLSLRIEDGDLEDARKLGQEVLRINPELTAELALRTYPVALRSPELLAAFRTAGLP
jgi:TolB-like protein/DNA-binding winged helix-turn-helix (wHTH) protein/Tfp pilus assembly protein PilF